MGIPAPPVIGGLLSRPLDFRHVFDEIPIGVSILDLDLHVVYTNRAFEILTGMSLDDAYGVPCRDVLKSRQCLSACTMKDLDQMAGGVSCETDIINRDRKRVPVRLTLSPILSDTHEVVGYMKTLEDLRPVKKKDLEKQAAYSFSDIVGRSAEMEKIFQTLPVLSQSDVSMLITGETGTGKDLVAEAVHQTSDRAAGPFIKINCGALPETLLESEIFGHRKGAFTGAVENKPGRFKLAHNGTIFLTEIGDLPLSLQVKLLTFLDDRVIYPLGSTQGIQVNVRIIAATHRNLEQMVADGSFRKDLLFRLNVARIHLPPLREREGDVRLLLDHFLRQAALQLKREISGFSPEALAVLLTYPYEGNIRELKNIVEYAANMASGAWIGPEHLPAYLQDAPHPAPAEPSFSIDARPDVPIGRPVLRPLTENRHRNWAAAERDMIMDALVQAKGKKNLAAKQLGWGRSTLWRKMKHYGISE
ncbi:MAG: sigma-54-dependent Fis family transcriptional regulator [Deltaproteobacteria bacterium]|nr:MAG: sigma-54-dependent Fis family transcriptional regulator [Deltaproteobacteria bacterium]